MTVNKALWGGLLVLNIGLLSIPMGCGEKVTCDEPDGFNEQIVGTQDILFPLDGENTKIAQGFKNSSDFILHQIIFFIRKVGDGLEGDIRVSIQKDNAQEPDDSVISRGLGQNTSVDNIDTLNSKITIEFLSRPELKAGQAYFVVIEFTPHTAKR